MTTNTLSVTLASGDTLDVRQFAVEESLSRLFDVVLTAVSTSTEVDFEGVIGQPARFEILRLSAIDGMTRYWNGICVHAGQVAVEETGLTHYLIRIVPTMWLLTERRNYRVFQDMSELDIVLQVLGEWGIQPTQNLDAGSYPKRRMRTQYAETDFDLVNRLLEDIGVSYYFEQSGGDTTLVLVDAPNTGAQRPPVVFVAKPNPQLDDEHVTALRTHREVKPGRYTQSDVDYRKPLTYPLASSASLGNAVEAKLERYHHNYGSFLWKADGGSDGGAPQTPGDTPYADDRGPARTNEGQGATQVQKRLQAQRIDARVCSFATTAHDLRPGKVLTIVGYPRDEVGAPLLVVACNFRGTAVGGWAHLCETRYTDVDYRPPLRTPKPRTNGVESATVTGPAGEEIHTDEFGRLRLQFHWDREGAYDETSSCWVPVSQPWAGAGFGAISLARVGQEVIVDFLGADPDRPVVVGRVYTTTTPPPYQLPKYKMTSGHRSESSPRPSSSPTQTLGGSSPVTMGETPKPPAQPLSSRTHPTSSPLVQPLIMGRPRQPIGGGMGVAQLGGGSAPAAAPAASPAANGPGPLSGSPISQPAFTSGVGQSGASSPDGGDSARCANGIAQDDTASKEMLSIQAQLHLYTAVKANSIANVGANQVCTVAKNDTNIVGGFEFTSVTQDRGVEVKGDQFHEVDGTIGVLCKGKYLLQVTPTGYQKYVAQESITLNVQKSTIVLQPNAIVINSPFVYINPGDDVMAGIAAGMPAADAVTAAQNAAAAAAAAAAKAAQIQKLQNEIKSIQEDKADALPGTQAGFDTGIAARQAQISKLQGN